MNTFPIALVVASRAARDEILNARPDAPVVPHVVEESRAPRAARTRLAVAARLHRFADAIEPVECIPAR